MKNLRERKSRDAFRSLKSVFLRKQRIERVWSLSEFIFGKSLKFSKEAVRITGRVRGMSGTGFSISELIEYSYKLGGSVLRSLTKKGSNNARSLLEAHSSHAANPLVVNSGEMYSILKCIQNLIVFQSAKGLFHLENLNISMRILANRERFLIANRFFA